jgi:pimeloyl-ACP methyl ester carboxylesterase
MNNYLKIFLYVLFFSASYTNATEIKQTTYAYWNKPDIELFYITPKKIDKDTELLFVMHGNDRNAKDYISAWIPHIKNKNIIVVAPRFDKRNYRYFFLLESANSSGVINNNSNDYINSSISSFYNFFQSKFSLNTNKYMMFGHSAGAQFTHRYMLLSNDKRISNAVVANAGWYTFLNGADFPYGINNSPIDITPSDIRWFMSNRSTLLIGGNDISLNDVNSSRGAINQGRTRLDRANNYFNVMIDIADKENIPLRWTYKVVDRVGHDYKKMTFQAAKILLQDVKSID